MSQNKHIYSAEAQEILEKIPSWIIRWGVSVLAAIAGFAIVACCIIKYPDTITGTITLIGTHENLRASLSELLHILIVAHIQKIGAGVPSSLL